MWPTVIPCLIVKTWASPNRMNQKAGRGSIATQAPKQVVDHQRRGGFHGQAPKPYLSVHACRFWRCPLASLRCGVESETTVVAPDRPAAQSRPNNSPINHSWSTGAKPTQVSSPRPLLPPFSPPRSSSAPLISLTLVFSFLSFHALPFFPLLPQSLIWHLSPASR